MQSKLHIPNLCFSWNPILNILLDFDIVIKFNFTSLLIHKNDKNIIYIINVCAFKNI